MCMTGILSQSIEHASAESITVVTTNTLHNLSGYISSSNKWAVSVPNSTYGTDCHFKIYINGKRCYCIDPYADIMFDANGNGTTNYSPQDLGSYFGNADMTQNLSEIVYYGYGYDGDTSDEMDYATQIRIWQQIGADIGDIHPDIQAKIDVINERLRICHTKVSFFGQEATLQGYGKENAVTFTDDNGVFQYYVDWKVGGMHTERNGNSLTVWAEPGDALEAMLDYNCFYLAHQDNDISQIAYTSPGSQSVAYIHGAPDPNRAWVKVKRIPTTVHLSKQDTNSNEIAGAHLSLADADGNEIESWVSTNEPHVITDLLPGHYTMTESLPANGFVGASSVEFDVLDTGEVQTFTMIDEIIRFNKVDQFGEPVKGATISVMDAEGNEVDTWVTGAHLIDITDEMIAQLAETGSIQVQTDDGETYSIAKTEDESLVLMITSSESVTSYYDIDMNGDETSHRIQSIIPNVKYIAKEKESPEYYLSAEDMEFTVIEDGEDQIVEMVDKKTKKISVSKQDITTKKELPGAKLEVYDKEGKLIDEWISTNKPHMIENLIIGETYTLIEKQAPDGYSKAEKIEFEIKNDGKTVQEVIMFDSAIPSTGAETYCRNMIYLACISAMGTAFAMIERNRHKKRA